MAQLSIHARSSTRDARIRALILLEFRAPRNFRHYNLRAEPSRSKEIKEKGKRTATDREIRFDLADKLRNS